MKAIKSMIFKKVEDLFSITEIDDETIPGYVVGLESVICWQIRELRLQGKCQKEVQLNLKLDGRPFGGKLEDQFEVQIICVCIYFCVLHM